MDLLEVIAEFAPGGEAEPIQESWFDSGFYDPDIDLTAAQGGAAYFRRITQSPADLSPLIQTRMQELALYLYDKNPLAKRCLELIRDAVVGNGFSVESKDTATQEIIDRFWKDGVNDMGSRIHDGVLELGLYGELAILVFVNERSGHVRCVTVDPRTIEAAITKPGSPDVTLAIKIAGPTGTEERYVKVINEDDSGMMVGAAPGETLTRGKGRVPVPYYTPEGLDPSTRLVGCFFEAINKTRAATRGRSDLLSVMDFVDMYDRLIFDEAERMSFLRAFVYDVEVKGADAGELLKKAMNEPPPKPGSVKYHNENERWTAVAPQLGAQDGATTADLILSLIATGVGVPKAQPLTARVLTASGWVPMGDVKVGTLVRTPSGILAPVSGVYPQGVQSVYRITMSDGTSTEATADHLWKTQTALDRRYGREGAVKTTAEIASTLRHGGYWNHYLPLISPENREDVPLPVDPYVLGVILGDGHVRTRENGAVEVSIATADPEVIGRVNARLDMGQFTPAKDPLLYVYTWPHRHAPLKEALRDLGLARSLAHDKFIPAVYFAASPEQRLELLRGLMDTDGSVSGSSARFGTVSDALARDVRNLVLGLGGVCKVWDQQTTYTYRGVKKNGRPSKVLRFALPEGTIPFALERKIRAYAPALKEGRAVRTIRSVEYVRDDECQCIAVDHPDRLYVTDDYIVTHNTWLNGSMDVNKATAYAMDDPAVRRLKARQNRVMSMLCRIIRFVLDQAEQAGALKPAGDTRHQFSINTPEISGRDLEKGARSLFSSIQALGMGKAAMWVDDETAIQALSIMLQELGIHLETEELQTRLDKMRAEREKEQPAATDGSIPSYLGVGGQFGSDQLTKAIDGKPDTKRGATAGGQIGDNATPAAAAAGLDPKSVTGMIAQVSGALVQLGTAGVIDVEVAQDIVVKFFEPLGISIDVEAMRARIKKDEAENAEGAPAEESIPDDLPEDLAEAFDESKIVRGPGGRFASKPDSLAAKMDAAGTGDVAEYLKHVGEREKAGKGGKGGKGGGGKGGKGGGGKGGKGGGGKGGGGKATAMSPQDIQKKLRTLKPGQAVSFTVDGKAYAGKVDRYASGIALVQLPSGKMVALHDKMKGITDLS